MLTHQLLEKQATRTPDDPAVVSDRGSLSYSALNRRSNQVARYLISLGVGANQKIGICCERSLELLIAIFGVLKAGAAYVPLDPAYPADRIEYMAQAANLQTIIAQACVRERLGTVNGAQVVAIDDPPPALMESGCDNPNVSVSGEDLMYVIFTSGSTGRPKGAGVYHKGFTNLLNWFISEFAITSSDRVLLVSSPSFDLTQKNFFAPLAVGGKLCLAPSGPYDANRLSQIIRDEQITLVNCTPSAFYPVIERDGGFDPLNSLRVVFLGGETISVGRLRTWLTSAGCRAEVANTYGPTECTDICGFYRLTRGNMDAFGFVPLGRAIPNTELLVVNDVAAPCGIGEAGELWVGGAGVGAGYINDPELTQRKFVPNTFSGIKSPVLYRTGDQVRWIAEGLLEFLGRKDDQIKIRGFRVELQEIESVMREHSAVKDAVVVVRERNSTGGEIQLKAYFTAQQGELLKAEDLREFVRARLPLHMVPALMERLLVFPLSPNGKVDRNSLAARFRAEALADAPVKGSDLQSRITGIWAQAIGSTAFGLDDNFFDAGGDSLALARVHDELQKITGSEFPITDLFLRPTVRGWAERLAGSSHSVGNAQVIDRAQRQRMALEAAKSRRR